MYERNAIKDLIKRIKEPRRFIQVLMGPRQVGKTTLVNQLFTHVKTDYLFETADAIPAGNSLWIAQVWETARIKMDQKSEGDFLLVVNEIARVTGRD